MIEAVITRGLLPLALVASLFEPLHAQDRTPENDKVRDTVKRLEAVLSEVDARLAGASLAQTEVETQRAENVALRQQLTVAMTQVQQRARDAEAARAETVAVRAELETRGRAVAELQKERDERRRREEELAGQAQQLEQRATQAAGEIARLRQQAAAHDAARDAELAQARTELAQAREAAARGEQAVRDAVAKERAAQDEAERCRADTAAAMAQVQALAAEVRQLREKAEAVPAAPRPALDAAPVQIHHHGSGNIILHVPARPARASVEVDAAEAATAGARRIDE